MTENRWGTEPPTSQLDHDSQHGDSMDMVSHKDSSGTEPPDHHEKAWLRDLLAREDGFYHIVYSQEHPEQLDALDDLLATSRCEELRPMAEGMAAADGVAYGRVLVVADDLIDSSHRVFTSIQLARVLAEGGARVLLVDAEFEKEGLSALLPDAEHEGFIDLASYGVSVQAAVQSLGVERLEAMSVGSYRPFGAEPFGEEEMVRAIVQMRSAASYVILVGPARLADGRFNPLFIHADRAILSLTLGGADEAAFQETVEYLRGQAIPIGGVAAYTTREEIVGRVVEGRLDHGPAAAPVGGEADSPKTEASSSPSDFVDDEAPSPSSPIFRWATIIIAVCLVAFVSWWALVQRQGGGPGSEGLEELAPSLAAGDSGPGSPIGGIPGEGTPDGADEAGGGDAAPDESVAPAAALADEDEEDEAEAQLVSGSSTPEDETSAEIAVSEPPRSLSPEQTQLPGSDDVESSEAADLPAQEAEPLTPAPVLGEGLAAALLLPPESGYALHVWSFPDSIMAWDAMRPLVVDGYTPIIQRATVEGRGTWYRVLVGNFGLRRDALRARDLLTRRPDVDYVGVVTVRP